MRVIKIGVVSLIMLGIAACSTVGDRYGFLKDETKSYKKVKSTERPVVIPQHLSSNNVQDYYEVPSAAEKLTQTSPSLAPPGSGLQENTRQQLLSQQDKIRNAENAKILGHTAFNQSANRGPTAVEMGFSQTWMKIGHVLQASNYKIVEKDSSIGTYYVIDTHNTSGKVKKDMPIYQVHLKASGGSTMVSVSPANPALQNHINRSLNQ
jgi:uncharacterized lipoprotein